MVPAGARGVQELAPSERGPRVDEDHDRGMSLVGREEVVHELEVVRAERGPVPPHVDLAGESLDHVDGGVPAVDLVVAGREVHPQGTFGRVAKRVPRERSAPEDVLLDPPGELPSPRLHVHPLRASRTASYRGGGGSLEPWTGRGGAAR